VDAALRILTDPPNKSLVKSILKIIDDFQLVVKLKEATHDAHAYDAHYIEWIIDQITSIIDKARLAISARYSRSREREHPDYSHIIGDLERVLIAQRDFEDGHIDDVWEAFTDIPDV